MRKEEEKIQAERLQVATAWRKLHADKQTVQDTLHLIVQEKNKFQTANSDDSRNADVNQEL